MSPFLNDILSALTGTCTGGNTRAAGPARLQPAPTKHPRSTQHISRHGVGLIAFNETAYTVAKLADPHSPWLQQRAASLPNRKRFGLTTNGTAAIRLGLQMLERRPQALKQMWLISDGVFNEETGGLTAAISAARRAGVTISCVGIGSFDGRQLGEVAQGTGGRVVIVRQLRQLSAELKHAGYAVVNHAGGRPSAMVIAIDTSGSMDAAIPDGRTRLQATVEAVIHVMRAYAAAN